MVLHAWLLDLLVCPRCRERVAPNDDATALACRHCRLDYPVRDGVPQMLEEAARPWREDREGPRADA